MTSLTGELSLGGVPSPGPAAFGFLCATLSGPGSSALGPEGTEIPLDPMGSFWS